MELGELKDKYDKACQELSDKAQLLRQEQSEKARMREEFQREFNELNFKVDQKDEEYSRMNSTIKRLKRESLREELSEMKKLVEIEEFFKIESQIKHIGQTYDELMLEMEQKIFELGKVNNENLHLRDRVLHEEERRRVLEEKVKTLMEKLEIFERELTQRKELSENLLKQNTDLEKQILFHKKMKQDAINRSDMKQKNSLI